MWGTLSTTGFSSQTQTAALLIWVMTHKIISSKRSVVNDYFFFIDQNPIIFSMQSVSRKMCPSDVVKKTNPKVEGCWRSSTETDQTIWQRKHPLLTFIPAPYTTLLSSMHFPPLFCFSYGREFSQYCSSLSFISLSASGLHAASQFSRALLKCEELPVFGTHDRKTKTCHCQGSK